MYNIKYFPLARVLSLSETSENLMRNYQNETKNAFRLSQKLVNHNKL